MRRSFIALLTVYIINIVYTSYLITGTIRGVIDYDGGAYNEMNIIIMVATLIFSFVLIFILYKKWYIALPITILIGGMITGWVSMVLCTYFLIVAWERMNKNSGVIMAQKNVLGSM